MVSSKHQQRKHWAIACVLLCLLQWFSVAAHALTTNMPIGPSSHASLNASDEAHTMAHCHGNIRSDNSLAVQDLTHDKSASHACCDDGCPMIDCHLFSAMVAPPAVVLTVTASSIESIEPVHSVRLYTSPPDRPPAQ